MCAANSLTVSFWILWCKILKQAQNVALDYLHPSWVSIVVEIKPVGLLNREANPTTMNIWAFISIIFFYLMWSDRAELGIGRMNLDTTSSSMSTGITLRLSWSESMSLIMEEEYFWKISRPPRKLSLLSEHWLCNHRRPNRAHDGVNMTSTIF